jgi:hypothetical protein
VTPLLMCVSGNSSTQSLFLYSLSVITTIFF